jgi:hypothetical protein
MAQVVKKKTQQVVRKESKGTGMPKQDVSSRPVFKRASQVGQKVNLLLCGPSKTGKTRFALSAPNPIVIDSDHGSSVAMQLGIDPPVFELTNDQFSAGMNAENGQGWLTAVNIIDGLHYKKGPYWEALVEIGYEPETIVFDSVHAFSDLCEVEVVDNPPDGKAREETLFLSDYNLIMRRMLGVLKKGTASRLNFIATAGIDLIKEELTGRIVEQPAASGNKLGPRVPYLFDDVYVMSYDGKESKYSLSPVPTMRFSHAGSRRGIPMRTFYNADFDTIAPYYFENRK